MLRKANLIPTPVFYFTPRYWHWISNLIPSYLIPELSLKNFTIKIGPSHYPIILFVTNSVFYPVHCFIYSIWRYNNVAPLLNSQTFFFFFEKWDRILASFIPNRVCGQIERSPICTETVCAAVKATYSESISCSALVECELRIRSYPLF